MSKSPRSRRRYTQGGSHVITEAPDFFPASGTVVKDFISVRRDHLLVEDTPPIKKAVNPGSRLHSFHDTGSSLRT